MNEHLKSLIDDNTFGEKIEEIKETHISYVFLTKNYAYKIKKDVKFSFLDYSTLEKREFNCREELRINKLLSPEIYLKVSPITKIGNSLRLSDQGLPLDYAVVMKRIPEYYIMRHLLEKNKIEKDTIEEIALKIFDFHKKADMDLEGKYGAIDRFKINLMDNYKDLEPFIGDIFSNEQFNVLISKNLDFINNNKDLFNKRVEKGKIIETHGDLHSGNIFVTPENIFIFDAIEFNKTINTTDVTAEIAFLCMDLEFLEKKDLSKAFSDKYISISGDNDMGLLLSFYKGYRACVRAKVNGYRASEDSSFKEITKKYFDLALKYTREF